MSAEIDPPRGAVWSMAPIEYRLEDGTWLVCAEGVEVTGRVWSEAYDALRREVARRRGAR